MSISINVYRVGKAESLQDLQDLGNELEIAENTKVDLYKMTEDLALIFTNQPDPFADTQSFLIKCFLVTI
ncbi:MAG: hypothetical protein JWN76_2311 [Chitinophagaceae bacterium]|nr:hypothetical protein [Chitinophagaceae bacterium]